MAVGKINPCSNWKVTEDVCLLGFNHRCFHSFHFLHRKIGNFFFFFCTNWWHKLLYLQFISIWLSIHIALTFLFIGLSFVGWRQENIWGHWGGAWKHRQLPQFHPPQHADPSWEGNRSGQCDPHVLWLLMVFYRHNRTRINRQKRASKWSTSSSWSGETESCRRNRKIWSTWSRRSSTDVASRGPGTRPSSSTASKTSSGNTQTLREEVVVWPHPWPLTAGQ